MSLPPKMVRLNTVTKFCGKKGMEQSVRWLTLSEFITITELLKNVINARNVNHWTNKKMNESRKIVEKKTQD